MAKTMMSPPSAAREGSRPAEVWEASEEGWSVVAANERIARDLRRVWDDERRARADRRPWQPAPVLSWRAWTEQIWQGLVMDGRTRLVLLNEAQEGVLWREIVDADRDPDVQAGLPETRNDWARLAGEAARRVWAWGAGDRLERLATDGDARAFLRWFEMFERRCKEEGWVGRARLESVLGEVVRHGDTRMPGWPRVGMFLVGSEHLTPAGSALVQVLEQRGVRVVEGRVRGGPARRRVLVRAGDEAEEVRGCAQWVRDLLDERPRARVAIVVPHLDDERTEIDRVFREVISPELSYVGAEPGTEAWEISQAVRLPETAMVSTALSLLGWAARPIEVGRIGQMLVSGSFGGEQERAARSEFDARELREQMRLRPEMSLEELTRAVDRSRRADRLPELRGALREMIRVASSLRGERRYGDWAQKMAEFLRAARWCERNRLDPVGAQLAKRWEEALDGLASLDLVGSKKVGFGDAIENLQRIAERTFFAAAEEAGGAPVQVIAPKDATCERFDAVWFLRGGDRVWPERSAIHPMLPLALQREFKMPGADVENDRVGAREMTRRIVESGETVVCSYAKHPRDGQQKAAGLLVELLGVEETEIGEIASVDLDGADAPEIATEWVDDVEQVGRLPDRVVSGGARLLEFQAACGFQAFAEGRLEAHRLRRSELGMDARERGNAIHRALELFWGEVQTQDALRRMDAAERSEAVGRAVTGALVQFARGAQTAWDSAYMEMVGTRLKDLVGKWLKEVELGRALPFRVKLREEKLEDVRVGPIRLNLRIDRVDETERGEVLIDYKTGMSGSKPRGWVGERMDAPQLPMYATSRRSRSSGGVEEQIEAVAFGRVVAGGDMQLHGMEGSSGTLPRAEGIDAGDLQSQMDVWESVLGRLAEQYARGDARVDPKSFPGTCRKCAQRLLCRVDASAMAGMLEEDEEEVELG